MGPEAYVLTQGGVEAHTGAILGIGAVTSGAGEPTMPPRRVLAEPALPALPGTNETIRMVAKVGRRALAAEREGGRERESARGGERERERARESERERERGRE